MERAIKFRRRLMEGGILLVSILLLGFWIGIRSTYETRRMNQWVSHTQEVLTEAASVRLQRARMQNDLWFYRATGKADLLARYQTDRRNLLASAGRLREFTQDNSHQQTLIYRVVALLEQQTTLLDNAMDKAQSAFQSGKPQEFIPAISPNDELPRLMDEFEAAEHRLFGERSGSVQKSAQWTFDLLIATGILGSGSLLLAGYYIQREILTRAKIETGLRRARELMGTQLDQQRSELGHAVEDLHAQIVARNEAEEEMRQLNLELESRVAIRTKELQEMNRELEAFNYSVSHDLRAPLRHVDGFSRILEEEFAEELSPSGRHYLQRIRLAAKQMSNLVEDLLQLARFGRQAVKSQSVQLGKIVEETIAACTQDEGNREIAWEIADLPRVEADEGLVRQVFANLISNAVKFTRKRNPAVIEIGWSGRGNEVTVFVKDNGAGFDPRFADKLFGVFQRLHRQDEFEGSGIGLAIVARIIHKHGGRVWAESKPDQGATFYFTLARTGQSEKSTREMIGVHA